jgi:SAM-dependent methyltransferase
MADRIPSGATVTDLCCGPGTLYHRYLKPKGIHYTGLDINPKFAADLSASGAIGLQWDMAEDRPFPAADYVMMQASLYHFLPNPAPIVNRMRAAARDTVLIAEPIRNMADSTNPLFAWMGKKFTNPGTGEQAHRFNERLLDQFFLPYIEQGAVRVALSIAGGREKLYILSPEERVTGASSLQAAKTESGAI